MAGVQDTVNFDTLDLSLGLNTYVRPVSQVNTNLVLATVPKITILSLCLNRTGLTSERSYFFLILLTVSILSFIGHGYLSNKKLA